MKILLTLIALFACSLTWGQAKRYCKFDFPEEIKQLIPDSVWATIPDTFVCMDMNSAAIVEYWGLKGINGTPVVNTDEKIIATCDKQIEFITKLYNNCQTYEEEYRKKLEHMSVLYNDKVKDYIKLQVTSDMWEKKAKNRGATIWAGGGALAIILTGIILAK